MEENYKNREIDLMFHNLEEKLKEKHDDMMEKMIKLDSKMDKMLEKQTYTNGKVARHDFWMKAFWWFFGFLGTLLIMAVPIARYVVLNEIHTASEQAVNDAFDSRFSSIEVVQ